MVHVALLIVSLSPGLIHRTKRTATCLRASAYGKARKSAGRLHIPYEFSVLVAAVVNHSYTDESVFAYFITTSGKRQPVATQAGSSFVLQVSAVFPERGTHGGNLIGCMADGVRGAISHADQAPIVVAKRGDHAFDVGAYVIE